MTNSISHAASAEPKRPLVMTACSSRDPMIPRRSASQLSTSINPVWLDLGSGFEVDSRWRGAGSRRYSFVCIFVVMGMLNEALCRQEYEVSYVIMYISIHWLEFCFVCCLIYHPAVY